MGRLPVICFALVLVIVLAVSGSASVARAETAPARDAPTSADAPVVAPPLPAKAAEPTPIVPSPQKPLHPAFQLYAEIDLPILGIGLVFAEARMFRSQKAFCSPLCDANGLNALDRTTAGYWSTGWQTASDIGLYTLGVGAAALLLADEGPLPALNDAVVVAESALASTAVASIMTIAAGRPRPFLYGEKAPLPNRNSADAGLSFLSSHAAVSFAIATSTFMTMRRLHPHAKATWAVMGVGGAMAAFVGAARIMGGMHFISDSVGGAIVGTSLGVLVPALHASPVAIVPMTGKDQRGVALNIRF